MMQYLYEGVSPVPTGNKYISSAPYDSFKAKDDYFVIASGTDKHFVSLSAAMGMPELSRTQSTSTPRAARRTPMS